MQGFPFHLKVQTYALLSRIGSLQAILVHAAVLLVFGVFLPLNKGVDFMDPVITSAYACLGMLFAAPAAAQSFLGEQPQTMSEVMARIVMAVFYGEAMAVALLAAGFGTVYFTHLHRIIFTPDFVTLAWALAMGLMGSLALATGTAYFSLRFSAKAARTALRATFIVLLVGFLLRAQRLPDYVTTGTFTCTILAAAELFGLWLAMRAAGRS